MSLTERLPKKIVELQKTYDLVQLLGLGAETKEEICSRLLELEELLDDAYNELKEKQNV